VSYVVPSFWRGAFSAIGSFPFSFRFFGADPFPVGFSSGPAHSFHTLPRTFAAPGPLYMCVAFAPYLHHTTRRFLFDFPFPQVIPALSVSCCFSSTYVPSRGRAPFLALMRRVSQDASGRKRCLSRRNTVLKSPPLTRAVTHQKAFSTARLLAVIKADYASYDNYFFSTAGPGNTLGRISWTNAPFW